MDILLKLRDRFVTGLSANGPVGQNSTVAASIVSLLSTGPLSEDELCTSVIKRHGEATLPEVYYILNKIKRENLIDYDVSIGGRVIASVRPANGGFRFSEAILEPEGSYTFSRFAYARTNGPDLTFESPIAEASVRLLDPSGLVLPWLFRAPCSLKLAACEYESLRMPKEFFTAWCELLLSVRVLTADVEPDSDELATWEFHDALFHKSTRLAPGTHEFGGTYRFLGRRPAQPASKPEMPSDVIIRLKAPRMQDLIRNDPPFTEVLERRRSVRRAPKKPITVDLLAEFLYRVASTKAVHQDSELETMQRRYPSAGGIHELEFYVAVNECVGLNRAFLHYDGEQHVLRQLRSTDKDLTTVFSNAAIAWGQDYPPQVLIVLASRFGRIAWKYEKLAYRVTLIDCGVAIQTMYLVATAMNLAPCALGSGDSSLFSSLTGLHPLVEGSVAEFALNSLV